MISSLSEKFTEQLISDGSISEENRELYNYGFFVFASHFCFAVLAMCVGIAFGCFIESIIFYVSFQFIRKYAGGYHASSEVRCEVISSLSIIASVGLIKLAKVYDLQMVLLIFAIISVACIFALSPLDTPEKKLDENERKHFRKISWAITLIIIIAVVASYLLSIEVLIAPCCVSLILESILLLFGKIKMKIKVKN